MITPQTSTALLIVDTREHQKALLTIERNRSLMKFDQVLFFTDQDLVVDGITTVKIPTISSRDKYSQIIIEDIADHIKTDQVLVTQCDGYIYNQNAWTDEFSSYDYIGAPWWYFPYNHVPPHPPSGPRTCVGNGGFSLRSAKLCRAIKALAAGSSWPSKNPEDLFICRTLRPALEEQGMTWAPEYLAHQFCCEDRVYDGQFGIHGHETLKLNKDLIES
jgi:hypothetical protein